MLAFGFLESGAMDRKLAWIIGMAAWLYIIYEIWFGDAKKAAEEATEGVVRIQMDDYILTFGWAIYPVGVRNRNGCRRRRTKYVEYRIQHG